MSFHGLPCWYELAAGDVEKAKAFYGPLLGWTWADSGMPGMTYLLASAGPAMVAGMMKADAGMPVAWTFYVAVDNADATAKLAADLGARVIVPPTDIPNTGRFSIMIDPQGAAFAILQPLPGGSGGAFDQQKMGHGNWHDLSCPDSAAATAFYGKLFGWTVSRTMQMGPAMTYHTIAAQGQDIGGIYTEAGSTAPVEWRVYFGIEGVKKAEAAIPGLGGTVVRPPAEVPGGAFILACADPAGARFALVGPA